MSTDWRRRAACRDEDPDLFFPIGNTAPALLQADQAKAVCDGCPVRQVCLEDALRVESELTADLWDGIRGGMTVAERFDLYLKQRRDTPPAPIDVRDLRKAGRKLHDTGLTARQIAARVGVTERTVERWRSAWSEAA